MEPSGRPPASWIYKEAEMPVGPLAKDNSTGWRLGDRTTAPPPLPPALSFLFLLPLVLGAPTFTALPPSATREDLAWHTEPYATGAGALPSRETAQSSTAAGASGKKSGRLRLVGGPGPCRGRVEVLYAGGWGTVCDDDWDFADARVACREAGCGPALGATGLGHFGYGSGPVLLDNVGCAGTEARLSDCFHLGWGQHNCGHHEDAGALCSGPEELGLQAQQEGAETTRVPTPRPRDATRFQTLF